MASVVFMNLTQVPNIVTLRYSFQNTGDGANPKGGLTLSTFNGKLYGMTSLGGANNYGVIFEFNPVGFVYTKLADLTSTTGTSPDKMSFLEYLPLTATISGTNTTCNGFCTGSATVTPNGGTAPYTYSWAPVGGTAATASSLCAGSYTCTITEAGGTVITKTITITQPAVLVATPSTQTNVSCNGGSNGTASVIASGGTPGYSYNWGPGNPTGDGTASVTGLIAGTWACTVTDLNGCFASSPNITINQPTALGLTSASQTNISCNGGSNGAAAVNAAVGGTPGYTYNWTPGNPTGDGTLSISGLIAANWTCTVTDANSCTAIQTFNVTQPTALVVSSLSQTNVSCNAGTNGAASVSVSGGTTAYTYNWTPGNPTGDGTASVTGLAAGSWTCTVTDANGCVGSQIFTITQPSALVVSSLSQTNVSCNAGTNGAASVSVSGGTTAYTYNWTPGNPTGDGTASVTGLAAGSWTCTVTDANGCVGSQIFTITQPSALVVSNLSQTNVSCNAGTNGAASVSVSGGTTAYTYNWTPGNPTGDGTASVTGRGSHRSVRAGSKRFCIRAPKYPQCISSF
ncbi:MAG: SprB repeat-containing protein [Bacteroidetes bacterium]|nr:SprB repeat-containing protein [Bacteroidota bacterium]